MGSLVLSGTVLMKCLIWHEDLEGLTFFFLFPAVQMAFCISSSVTGLTLYHWKWDYTFYFYGVCGLLFCIFWVFLCYSVPEDHPYITERELSYLNETVAPKKIVKPVPWKQILSSLPVWGLIIGQIGRDWAVFTMIHELPAYMKDILGFNIRENGFLTALPYLCMWLCSLAAGALADWIVQRRKMAVVNVRRVFSLVGKSPADQKIYVDVHDPIMHVLNIYIYLPLIAAVA